MEQTFDPGEFGRKIDPERMSLEEVGALLGSAAVADLDAGGVDDQVFLRLVSTASKAQIEAVMRSEARSRVLAEIFGRMGQYVRPGRLSGERSVVHWRIAGRPDGGYDEFETIMDSSGVTVSPGVDNDPRVTLTTGPVEFLKLVSGQASGPMLFITGKLKIKGDLGYAAGLPSIFAIPAS